MKKGLLLLLLCLGVMVGGCAIKTESRYTPPKEMTAKNTAVYNAPLEKVWQAAIKSIGENFFVLDNITKDSRIITLSFSADTPADFIDCGKVFIETQAGVRKNTYNFDGAAKSTQYLACPQPGLLPTPFERKTKLEGKANVIFTEEGKGQTRVTVNARYVFTVTGSSMITNGAIVIPFSKIASATFTTGQSGKTEGGTICYSKNTLEQKILDGIKSKLQ